MTQDDLTLYFWAFILATFCWFMVKIFRALF